LHLLGLIAEQRGDHEACRDLLRRAAQAPDTTALCLLSFAELGCRGEDPAAALGAVRRALQLEPTLPLAWYCLGKLLAGTGEFAPALIHAERAIELAPAVLEYQLMAADLETQLGRPAAALARLELAATRWPDDPRRLALAAHVLCQSDRLEQAAALCREAQARGIESAELCRACGLALQLAGDDEGALASFDRSTELGSGARALTDKAVLLAQAGRFEEARETLEVALRTDPSFVEGWYNKVDLKTCAPGDADIEALERLLQGHRTYRDRLLLHFALGKAYMDSGDGDAAFRHWLEGNRMKRATLDYDAEASSRDMAGIAAGLAAAPLRAAAAGSGEDLPVFIVGMPRSGSTLTEQILASHPQIHSAGELTGLRSMFEAHPMPPDGDLKDSLLGRLRSGAPQASRIIDKDLGNFLHLGRIHAVLPGARIIHCRRDPVDTCFSVFTKLFAGHFGYAYDLRELGRYYRDYHALMARWRAHLPSSVLLDVDYEELVRDPGRQSRRMLEFLGLSWHEACGRFFESGRAVRTSSFAQVRRPVYLSSVGRAAGFTTHLQPLIDALGDLASGRRA
jgi:tetratricopeptide (TPR) repeat protein